MHRTWNINLSYQNSFFTLKNDNGYYHKHYPAFSVTDKQSHGQGAAIQNG